MDVSENMGGVPPKSSHFSRVFHYKPSILGYPYFWKHPYGGAMWLTPDDDDDDRICILMDALHDRILMEDQKWWAGAAFCSLATLARFPHVRIQI